MAQGFNPGFQLTLLRGVLGMTRGELAERLGYSAAYIRDLESGRFDIGLPVHKKLAQLVQGDTYCEIMAKLERRHKIAPKWWIKWWANRL